MRVVATHILSSIYVHNIYIYIYIYIYTHIYIYVYIYVCYINIYNINYISSGMSIAYTVRSESRYSHPQISGSRYFHY